MKKTNKFFALFLSLILLIGTAMPVYAFDEEKNLPKPIHQFL